MYANCTNTVGSYICTCNEGYRGDGSVCNGKLRLRYYYDHRLVITSINTLVCDHFIKFSLFISDINECQEGTDSCDDESRAECNNTDGSYSCSCTPGYSGDGINCTSMVTCIFEMPQSLSCLNPSLVHGHTLPGGEGLEN